MTTNKETTMAYEIESVKGNVTVDSIEAAAKWIGEMQPAFVSVNGESIEYSTEDDDATIAAKIRAAVMDVADEQIAALRTEAGAAGDTAQVELCDMALAGDADARRECAEAIADAAAQESTPTT